MKKILVMLYNVIRAFLFDPIAIIKNWRGTPYFLSDLFKYIKSNKSNSNFKVSTQNFYPILGDRFLSAGGASGHYFYQDLWASDYLYKYGTKSIVDIGSRLDGYIAHILPFCQVEYVDIREIKIDHTNFHFVKGDITNLPYESSSVTTVSCLHVIEHIGLGRYGDTVDAKGYIKAAKEISRIVASEGTLLLGTPVGKQALYFNAHRVFDPEHILGCFPDFEVLEMALINDKGQGIIRNPSFELIRECKYGCGLFILKKKSK